MRAKSTRNKKAVFGGTDIFMTLQEINNYFSLNAEKEYREFSLKLTNNSSLPTIGLRLPKIRRLARDILRYNPGEFLELCDFSSIEMSLLYSYVLGGMKGDIKVLIDYFDKAAGYVDNWCTCDTLCQSFKQARNHRSEVYEYLMRWRDSGNTFRLRIVAVMLLCHFLTDEYIDRVFEFLSVIRDDGYYYKMGVAWAVATTMSEYPEKCLEFLKTWQADDWTYNKAIQKMLESYRIESNAKQILKKMKR